MVAEQRECGRERSWPNLSHIPKVAWREALKSDLRLSNVTQKVSNMTLMVQTRGRETVCHW
jgi:hypothetical protein